MDQQTEAMLARAAALRRGGRVNEAIAAYGELLQREPDLPDSWYNLGWLQRQARRYRDALDSYREALDRGVGDPEEVHLNRAAILSDHLACPDEAEAELQAALALNPDYLPAMLNLGNLREDGGDRDGAEAAYRRALEIAPGNALALSRLAGVARAGTDESKAMVTQLREALTPALPAAEKADIGFALGRLLDADGRHDEAFAAYAAANAASRESFGNFRPYDRAAQEAFVDRSIAAFPAAERSGGALSPSIFIVGMFRSGSTLVEQILAGHSAIAAGGELDLIPTLAGTIGDYPQAVGNAPDAEVDRWRAFYREGIAAVRRGDALVTDKRPDNFLHVGLIKTLFPAAKIIHTRRNRLDNLLSLHFLHLDQGMPHALDLADAAHWYAQYERLMAHWQRIYGADIVEVDYDALVLDPEPVVDRVVSALGLDPQPGLLDFHRRKAAVKTASVWQVREPLHARSSGRWRHYSKQLEQALGATRD